MTDMQGLLEQWAGLEPDRCRDASESPVRHDKEVSMGQDWWQVWDCTEAIEMATVQAAVQEAIEALGLALRAALVRRERKNSSGLSP